jgi:hypothetical protein
MAAQGKVSGRVVVITLFSGAILMWGVVLLAGYRQKQANRSRPAETPVIDTASGADQIRSWMSALPESWVKVTQVEGQGYVLYVPCYSSNSALTLRARADSLPGVNCDYCDSLGQYLVTGISRSRQDSVWEFRLEPKAGRIRLLPVDDTLLRNFPEAPFKDKILLWTRPRDGGRADSMLFVPKTQETEFEVLRAEDENPEGCGTESE